MRYRDLTEAPLQDFGLLGNTETPGSFRADDLRAMTNPKWVEKLNIAFSKTQQNFNIYAVNADEDGKHRWTTKHFKDAMNLGLDNFRNYKGEQSPQWFETRLGFLPPQYESSVNILFTFNEGSGRMPFTQWMIAHRLIHAIGEGRLGAGGGDVLNQVAHIFDIINDILFTAERYMSSINEYDRILATMVDDLSQAKGLAQVIGKTRALRTGNITSPGEFMTEFGAQYLVTGSISLNRVKFFGETIRYIGMEMDEDVGNEKLDRMTEKLNRAFRKLFELAVGKIFVL